MFGKQRYTDSKTFNFKERFGEEKSKSLDLTYYKRCRWVLVSLNEDDKSLINVHLRTQFTLQPINNNPETKFTFEIFERSN